jgi:membrane associated rhomboid family serine protease
LLPVTDNVRTRSFPIVTIVLIAVNVTVWVGELLGGWQSVVRRYAFYPCSVGGGHCMSVAANRTLPWYEAAFTSMFMHAGWFHLLGNMLFLWIFGDNVEDALGRIRFLVWYICAGLAATALQTTVTLDFGDAFTSSVPNVGASGAISGVLGAYFVLYPVASVLAIFLIFPVEIPAVIFIGVWFLDQWLLGNLSLLAPAARGGVAFFAHIGGFLFGAATARVVARDCPP